MKTCKDCSTAKPYEAFTKKASCIDGYESRCRVCRSIKYNKSSLELVAKKIYSSQRLNSVTRNHPPPAYTLKELTAWIRQQPKWLEIYKAWIAASYTKNLAPSIDRLDVTSPYTLDNIALITWEENRARAKKDIQEGVDTRHLKPVRATPVHGGDPIDFYSTAQAVREVGGSHWGITTVADGKPVKDGKGCLYQPKTYKGFYWSWL